MDIHRKIYLFLAIVGFVLPNIFVAIESIETGNILLYMNPLATFKAMFSNRISTIFIIDLLFAVLVFFIWSYNDSKRLGLKHIWLIWLLTLLFGFACSLPLYLFIRQNKNYVVK